MYLRLLPLSRSLAELTSVLFCTTRQGAGMATRLGGSKGRLWISIRAWRCPESGGERDGGGERSWLVLVWNGQGTEVCEPCRVECSCRGKKRARRGGTARWGRAKTLAREKARKMFYFVLWNVMAFCSLRTFPPNKMFTDQTRQSIRGDTFLLIAVIKQEERRPRMAWRTPVRGLRAG